MNKKNTFKKILFFIIIQNNIYNMNNRFSFGNNNYDQIIIKQKNEIKEWINNLALIYQRTKNSDIVFLAKEKILQEEYIETFFNVKDLENRSTRIILTFSKIIQNLENENINKK